ncbi:MAG: HlyC/CorC family transporter [bacterium]|nr:HlyC/CorC family transporter [bacterium]
MDDPYFGYKLLLVGFVILLNAFFAGAEVALVSVRQSRLKQLAADGRAGAKSALRLLENPERLLSVVQVGVTLASLALGWAGESTLYALFDKLAGPFASPATENIIHGVSFVAAFSVMAYLHVVIGEVVPKNLAIEKADRLAVLVAPVLWIFYRLSEPFVYVIERSAAGLSRALGLKGERLGGGHSSEELRFIIRASRRHGYLESFEERAIQRLLDLQDLLVREIMVPRSDIVSVPVEASLDDVLRSMAEHQFSRIPVYENEPEHLIGIVHYKDLLGVWREGPSAARFDLRRLMTRPFVVPETKPLNQLIDDFREEHSHMAIVVDEFGTVVGLVTMEDAIEQVFGEIEDEHDVHLPPVLPRASVLELDGATSIRDLETQHAIELPVDAGFETLAGYVLFRLGRIPETGDSLASDGYQFTVLDMEKNRIARVRIEKGNSEEPSSD